MGAVVLGHWGDTHGRKTVLILCMFLMGFSTMAVGVLPTYQQVGIVAPVLLVILRLLQGFAVAGRFPAPVRLFSNTHRLAGAATSRASPSKGCRRAAPRGSGVPAARAFHAQGPVLLLGLADSVLLSIVVIIAGYIIRREVDETPAFTEELRTARFPPRRSSKFSGELGDILRVLCMALTAVIAMVAATFGAAYAVQPAPASASLPASICGFRSWASAGGSHHSLTSQPLRPDRPPPAGHFARSAPDRSLRLSVRDQH